MHEVLLGLEETILQLGGRRNEKELTADARGCTQMVVRLIGGPFYFFGRHRHELSALRAGIRT
jgi:siroheme synthase